MLAFPSVAGVTHSFIEVKGTKLHVAQAGSGKPLILLHGWPQHWYVWHKVIPELSKTFRLIMPDLPGFGWSEMPAHNDFRKETLADYLLQLIDTLKLSHVDLVGHDWGGWIGFLLCLRQPKLFGKYLALGIGYPHADPISPLQLWRFLYQLPIATPFVGETLLRTMPHLTEWGIKRCAYKKSAWTKKDMQIFSVMLQNTTSAQASSLLYRTFLLDEVRQLGSYKNSKLHVPSHLLIGENDPIINPSLFQNNKKTENLQIEVIKRCGHFIPEEQPEVVIKTVRKLFH